ncbi:MAG: tRNA (adenosine(37)-N6)-threonylcarbamoyltransferase complex dimerization subunit type 1 TsaB [Mongoliibacter sp.]|uniref:tRNA (adenosine(37)-N6)-threonylcarbamoyltransferase complex dimerization subunit type 1 TsaB n=1 Tax=Mongoliibacter sp. TaxID=2022438 RepID=UPI0012F03C65|nr:tRNA (adenosine(37)-N6)-threonylcarbamoyltransferase complex dimerization subunit type 1 TsaB [Mongoliibacter sp.]TVP43059.1 MAG: tRNA (adenosine(37)-N6)-threonylcarbamoyltransferase complex dimerization subunit type 1 TsaB [Mongoliibacter sp.]
MSLILSVETATNNCSVALHENGTLIHLHENNEPNSHGRLIVKMIESLFTNAGVKVKDLQAVAVSKGPGSYTGLRIGVSTAKGISFGLGIPIIAVDTLKALAKQAVSESLSENKLIVPMIDARRMEVYTAIYDHSLKIIQPLSPVIVEENIFEKYLENFEITFLGDGMNKLKDILKHPNAIFLDCENSAKTIGELAFTKYANGEFEDLAYFEPNYLKDFQVLKSKKNLLLQ